MSGVFVITIMIATLALSWSGVHGATLEPLPDGKTDWYNVRLWGVSGKAWNDTQDFYDRLPARAQQTVPSAVWNLSKQSAGMYVEFQTDSTEISARWVLSVSRLAMPHMAATGVSGVDLYVQEPSGQWRWIATGQPDALPTLTKTLISDMQSGLRSYRMYLPLYNGVKSVEVGVKPGSVFKPILPSTERPIVFYGTSITQGAVASRPGMAYTNILGRRLDMPVINLGFSGSGKMELALAQLIAEIDAAVYVLDAFPNMDAGLITVNFERFVQTIREARPDTPIVIVEDRAYANTDYQPIREKHYQNTRITIQAAYDRLVASGVDNMYFVPRDKLFGTDFEATVDGSHPTDLGMMRYADILERVLRTVLELN